MSFRSRSRGSAGGDAEWGELPQKDYAALAHSAFISDYAAITPDTYHCLQYRELPLSL